MNVYMTRGMINMLCEQRANEIREKWWEQFELLPGSAFSKPIKEFNRDRYRFTVLNVSVTVQRGGMMHEIIDACYAHDGANSDYFRIDAFGDTVAIKRYASLEDLRSNIRVELRL